MTLVPIDPKNLRPAEPTPLDTSAYQVWIEDTIEGDGYAQCEKVVTEMAEMFPELEARKGFYHDLIWGRRTHWWCRHRETGRIIDPTGLQHPTGSLFPESDGAYEDLTDLPDEELARRVPSGVCMDCGDPVYEGKTFCSTSCERATLAYLNDPDPWGGL